MAARKLPRPDDFRFATRLRVRWAEVDLQGVVFNAHYLTYCDTALMDYWRALALPYTDTMAHLGGEVFLRSTRVDFHAPARLDDTVRIGLRCVRVGVHSFTFEAALFVEARLLAHCELTYVYADAAQRRAHPIPAPLRAALQAWEAGAAMVRTQTGSWAELGAAAAPVREAVFIGEQGIAAAEEMDAADAAAVHAVAYNRLDQAVGTARLLPSAADEPGAAHIGRVAVHHALRRTGLGRVLMAALEDVAAARGDRAIVLSAQRHAQHFYEGLGYHVEGAPYDEVNIPHVRMRKVLGA